MLVLFMLVACLFAWILVSKNNPASNKPHGLSPVCRQHMEFYQGEPIPPWLIEKQKNRLLRYIESGHKRALENMFVPGLEYLVNVRALVEIGDEGAAVTLQSLVSRLKCKDPLEKSWFLVDLANGLRNLQHGESIGSLVGYFNEHQELVLAPLLASEILCFDSFGRYYRAANTQERKAALRLVQSAIDGLYSGITMDIISESRLGDLVECIWENKPPGICPVHVCVFQNLLKLVKRCRGLSAVMEHEIGDPDEFGWQLEKIASFEAAFTGYLKRARKILPGKIDEIPWSDHPDYLKAFYELKCPPSSRFWAWLQDPVYPHKALLWESFIHHTLPIGDKLIALFNSRFPTRKYARSLPFISPAMQPELISLCKALKRHPSEAVEKFLLEMGQCHSKEMLLGVVSSLGWWEPFDLRAVTSFLAGLRNHRELDVCFAVNSALARFGERKALQWLRGNLNHEDISLVHQTIHVISTQGISLLWPELDQLVEATDADIAFHAREAIANLSEGLSEDPIG